MLNVKGVYGTFVGDWYKEFFTVQLFCLGRLEFINQSYSGADYTFGNFTLHSGDMATYIHIPSSGPLITDECIDSLKRAYIYFGKKNGEIMAFFTTSWLLYPLNKEYLSTSSNIVKLMDLFDIVAVFQKDNLDDMWRIIGKDFEKPIDELPAVTSLQKGYIKLFKDGKKAGIATGIIFFDGKK